MFSQVLGMKKRLCSFILLLSAAQAVNSLSKRSLVVPPTSPTRHQLISGIGIPLGLEDEAITLGLVLKAQYFLPETVNQLKFNFFPDIWADYEKDFLFDLKWHKFPNGRRRREILNDPLTGQSYESYDVNATEIGNAPLSNATHRLKGVNDGTMADDEDEFDDLFEEDLQDEKLLEEFFEQQQQGSDNDVNESDDFDLSSSRWVAYDALSSTLESKGFNGRMCVLRGICEAADVQFSEHLMGELFHIFFTPSTTSETVSKSSDYDYMKAELIGRGKADGGCEKVFHQCKQSIMEIFTEVYENKLFQFS